MTKSLNGSFVPERNTWTPARTTEAATGSRFLDCSLTSDIAIAATYPMQIHVRLLVQRNFTQKVNKMTRFVGMWCENVIVSNTVLWKNAVVLSFTVCALHHIDVEIEVQILQDGVPNCCMASVSCQRCGGCFARDNAVNARMCVCVYIRVWIFVCVFVFALQYGCPTSQNQALHSQHFFFFFKFSTRNSPWIKIWMHGLAKSVIHMVKRALHKVHLG